MNPFTGILGQHFKSPMHSPCIDLSPPPPHVLSTCGKPCAIQMCKLENLFNQIVSNTLSFYWPGRNMSTCVTMGRCPFSTCQAFPLNSKMGPGFSKGLIQTYAKQLEGGGDSWQCARLSIAFFEHIVHKLLTVITRFFVSLIKTLFLLEIAILTKYILFVSKLQISKVYYKQSNT